MPLYEYRCTECGERTEVLQKVSDPPLQICPRCSGRVTKLLSAPALQFKGSGFYLTDYARKNEPKTGEGPPTPAKGKDEGGSTPAKTSDSSSKPKADTSASKPASP